MNIPPDKRGLIHENDVETLKNWRMVLDQTFSKNLAAGANMENSRPSSGQKIQSMVDEEYDTYWLANGKTPIIEISLDDHINFDRLLLQEKITIGQRVEKFKLEAMIDGKWKGIGEGTTIGYKRILRFPEITTNKIRLTILQSRANPAIASFGLYKSPEGK